MSMLIPNPTILEYGGKGFTMHVCSWFVCAWITILKHTRKTNMDDFTDRIAKLEKVFGDSNDTDLDHNKVKRNCCSSKLSKRNEAEIFLTDIIRQFSNRNKILPQMLNSKSTEFYTTSMANVKPLPSGAGRGPARGNQNYKANQPNLHQCINQDYQLKMHHLWAQLKLKNLTLHW